MHSQPPLYNLVGGILQKLFYPYQIEILHYLHIVSSACSCGLVFLLLLRLTEKRWFSFWVTLILSLSPAIYLFQSYMLYEILNVFFILLCLFGIAEYKFSGKLKFLYLFIAGFTLLLCLRSLYQIYLLFIAIPFTCYLAGQSWKKVLICFLLASLLPFGWCLKNYIYYREFSSSSWGGLVLWKNAIKWYSPDELEQLAKEGILDPVIAQCTHRFKPSQYYQYGYNKASDIPMLNRDNYHNINIVDISKAQYRNAIALIMHEPFRYIIKVYNNYRAYCCPSSQYFDYRTSRKRFQRMHYHTFLYSDILLGRRVMGEYGSYLFFLIPLSILLYLIYPFLGVPREAPGYIVYMKEDYVMLLALFFILYNTILVCCVSDLEYCRYKFTVEGVIWIFIAVVGCRYYNLWTARLRRLQTKE